MSRRIRRVGLDTTVNYSLQQTLDYDANNPAGTAAPWGTDAEVALMDQGFEQTAELERQGVLVTFERLPEFFSGADVKLRPNYAAPDVPYFEMWTRDATLAVWSRRRRFPLNNLFSGVRSDESKVFDLRLVADLTNVDQVWLTMDPGAVGTPINRFIGIRLFGECNPDVTPPDPCVIDPDNCIDPPACLVHPEGVDELGQPCFIDPINPEPDPDPEPIPFPVPPPIDLCDEVAVAAFEATLTEEQMAYWQELLATVELDCDDDDACDHPPCGDDGKPTGEPINPPGDVPPYLPPQPTEEYIDPVDMTPAPDPDKQDEPPEPQDNAHYAAFFFTPSLQQGEQGADMPTDWVAGVLPFTDPETQDAYTRRSGVTGVHVYDPQPTAPGIGVRFNGNTQDMLIDMRIRHINVRQQRQESYGDLSYRINCILPGATATVVLYDMFTSNQNPLVYDDVTLETGGFSDFSHVRQEIVASQTQEEWDYYHSGEFGSTPCEEAEPAAHSQLASCERLESPEFDNVESPFATPIAPSEPGYYGFVRDSYVTNEMKIAFPVGGNLGTGPISTLVPGDGPDPIENPQSEVIWECEANPGNHHVILVILKLRTPSGALPSGFTLVPFSY